MLRYFKTTLMISSLLALSACSDEIFSEDALQPGQHNDSKLVNTSENAVPGTLLVKLRAAEEATVENLLAMTGGLSLERLFPVTEGEGAGELMKWHELTLADDADLDKVADILRKESSVQAVQFNTMMVQTYQSSGSEPLEVIPVNEISTKASDQMPFNDPMLPLQWHYINDGTITATAVAGADINVKDAWRLTAGDPSVIVAIVDDGIDYGHPDLAANMWVNEAEKNGTPGVDDDGNGFIDDIHGYNFMENGPVRALDGHGTHVAGTVAAVNNNGIGVCGVAGGTGKGDGVRLMSIQCFSNSGSTSAVMARGIKYAADNGACILQCSNGYASGTFISDNLFAGGVCSVESEALEYFRSKSNCEAVDGGIIIYAAGNEGREGSSYPGAWHDYISVTAFAPDFRATGYTNYGAGCNIAAPGGEWYLDTNIANEKAGVLSTYLRSDSEYSSIQGTSMACPHVSGIAALGVSYMLKLGKKCTADEFNAMLLTSVNDIDTYHRSGSKKTVIFNGNMETLGQLDLTKFRFKLGTGAIDTWKLLMQIEGTPYIMAQVGTDNRIDLSSCLGGGASAMSLRNISMHNDDKAAIGISELPRISNGKLRINPGKAGCAKIKVTFIAGGQNKDGELEAGGGDIMGGMEITKTISIISRGVTSDNGGWL